MDATSDYPDHIQKFQELEIAVSLGQEFLLRVLGLALLQRTEDNIFLHLQFS